jgi:hypothetical protein
MRFETFARTLRNRRRSLIGWSIATVGLVGIIVLSYVAIRGQQSFQDMMDQYPDFVKQMLGLGGGLSITSPPGYLNSQLFANTLPLIFLIFLIAFAARETAGEESDGTLDLALAHPVTRERFVLEKFAAMVVAGALLALLSVLTLAATGPIASLDIGWSRYHREQGDRPWHLLGPGNRALHPLGPGTSHQGSPGARSDQPLLLGIGRTTDHQGAPGRKPAPPRLRGDRVHRCSRRRVQGARPGGLSSGPPSPVKRLPAVGPASGSLSEVI